MTKDDPVYAALVAERERLILELAGYDEIRESLARIERCMSTYNEGQATGRDDRWATNAKWPPIVMEILEEAGPNGMTAREVDAIVVRRFPYRRPATTTQTIWALKRAGSLVHNSHSRRYYTRNHAPALAAVA